MKTLILDNYDSFTYNLYQYVAELGGEPEVHRNDAIDIEHVENGGYTHIVISPGPGNPYTERDIGISREVIEFACGRERGTACCASTPLLGVCLGHQILAVHFDGKVERAPEIFHGRASTVVFTEPRSALFTDVPDGIEAMRYHSLCITDLPEGFRITEQTEEGSIMAMEDQELPLFGIQFHPESIGTPSGKIILNNFLSMSS
jgi:anthranilate synthase component 2